MKKNILKTGMIFSIMALLIGISPLTAAQQVAIEVVDEGNLDTTLIMVDMPGLQIAGPQIFTCGRAYATVRHDVDEMTWKTVAICEPLDHTPTILTCRSDNYLVTCKMEYDLLSWNPPHQWEADEITFELYLEFDGEYTSRTFDLTETGDIFGHMEINSDPRSGITRYSFGVQTYIDGVPYASDHAKGNVFIIRRLSFNAFDLTEQLVLSSADYETFLSCMMYGTILAT